MQQMRKAAKRRDEEDDFAVSGRAEVPARAYNLLEDKGAMTPLGASFDGGSRPGSFMEHLGRAGQEDGNAGVGARGSLAPLRLRVNLDKLRLKDDAGAAPSPMGTPAAATLFAGRVDKLYLVLVSMHGLIRGENMELGKDADTGGQVGVDGPRVEPGVEHPAPRGG